MSEEKNNNSKKGFASNPNAINRRGRPLGSKNKLPSDPVLKELMKKNAPEAVQTIISIMRNSDKDETKLKAAFKLLDTAYTVILNDEKTGTTSKIDVEGSKQSEDEKGSGVVLRLTQQK